MIFVYVYICMSGFVTVFYSLEVVICDSRISI